MPSSQSSALAADRPAPPRRPSSTTSVFLAWRRWFVPALALVLLVDQLTKLWLFALPVQTPRFNAALPGPVSGMPGWIDRSYNPGVAWGMAGGFPGLVAVVTALLIPLLGWIWWRWFRLAGRWENLAFGAILGGALGNGIDRALARLHALGGVRDFIRVDLQGVGIDYVWPTFNVADAGICCGFAVLALRSFVKPTPAPAADRARAAV